MSATLKLGFTIIETMLFLSITGLLIVGFLAATGSSINIQRYHDSVQSLQSKLQDQYAEVVDVSNAIPSNTLSCDSNAVVTESASTFGRGQSDCVLMGRYITSSGTDGKNLTISDVVGNAKMSLPTDSSDLTTLQNYYLNIVPTTTETYSLEWGSAFQKTGSTDPLLFTMLILRSPASGVVRTFINPTAVLDGANIGTMITATDLAVSTNSLKGCVESGGLFNGNRMAVTVEAGASSGTGVGTLAEDSSGC